MKQRANLHVGSPAELVGEVLADLGTYPHWNDLVQEATATEPTGELPAWITTLRAQVGPLSRSKQLRFVRVVDEAGTNGEGVRNIRFERAELDGREHAAWVMETHVRPDGADSCTVDLELSYSGGLWMPALGNTLGGAIERATTRLPDYVSSLR